MMRLSLRFPPSLLVSCCIVVILLSSFSFSQALTFREYHLNGTDFPGATDANHRSLAAESKKAQRLSNLVNSLLSEQVPSEFRPEQWGSLHNKDTKYAIFAAAMSLDLSKKEVLQFCGTARRYGFDGDLVIAVTPGSNQPFLDELKNTHSIVYSVQQECEGFSHDKVCALYDQKEKYSINVVRYFLYKWWAMLYSENTVIMLSDFRDVLFQANPFTYRTFEWAPPVAQLVVFQENHPIKTINRCIFNGGWIENCYGTEALQQVGSNTVSCSGISFGVRNAIIAYTHTLILQLQPAVRYAHGKSSKPVPTNNKRCTSAGMDQGFHNYIIYSRQLERYMNVKIFQQGEGPVNTVGAFGGARAIIKRTLESWGILKGVAPNKYFYNWNGDKSPVVHQFDRFIDTTFKPGYHAHLGAVQGL